MRLKLTGAGMAAFVFCAPTFISGFAIADESARPGHTVSGTASWYGDPFHGRLTANGERFDMNEMTAAHPTLPFGSKVRVTNSRNDRSVEVRINDRGPYTGDRVIDLSRAAAKKVGIVDSGLAPVKLKVLREGS